MFSIRVLSFDNEFEHNNNISHVFDLAGVIAKRQNA